MEPFMISKSLQMITTVMLFFTKNYLKIIYCRIQSLFGDKKKTVKKWVIICKLFEIIKGSIIILSIDCNTHLHTISKKQKILNVIISGENKGEQVTKQGKNAVFWADRNFWPMGQQEVPKFGRVRKIILFGQDLQQFFI